MNTYEITIQADDNQIMLFALDNGWKSEVPDPNDIARVEAEMAAYELDNTVVVDPIVKNIPNPDKAEDKAMQAILDLVTGKLGDSYTKYYSTKSKQSLDRLLSVVQVKLVEQVKIKKIVPPAV